MDTKTELTSQLNSGDLSLEEKLAAIDAAMNDPEKQKEFNRANGRPDDTPVDPMDMLHCEGCQ